MYDVVIIGAGVSGCAVARYLSRYKVKACVLEREEDVCCGTSKANSAIIHAGYDPENGTLMAKYNVQGSKMMPALAQELDIPFTRNGSLVICLHEEDEPALQKLYERGVKNGVEGLEIVDLARLHELEPNITHNAVGGLYAPTGGIVCPFIMTIALAENAFANGVEFRFNTEVQSIAAAEDATWIIETNQGQVQAKCVVNAAGLYADVFHNMVSESKINITACRGDYFLLDHTAGDFVKHTVFQLPGKFGKGVLITPTIHGNLLVGPTSHDIENREGVNTSAAGLDELSAKAQTTVDGLPLRQVITSFAGLRAHEDKREFVLGEVEDAPGFFDVAGIESPGLSSAPAIGLMTADLLRDKLGLEKNPSFDGSRKGILDPKELSPDELNKLIAEEPAYGQIICRCENVSEGEILDAIRRPLGARSTDGVKRRVRAGMGRCQAGFCSPRVMEILARELDCDMSEITKSGGKSFYITGTAKEGMQGGECHD